MMNQIMEGALAQSSSIIFQVHQFPNLFIITTFLAQSQGAERKEGRKGRAVHILVNQVMKWEWPYKFLGVKDLTFLLCKFKNLIQWLESSNSVSFRRGPVCVFHCADKSLFQYRSQGEIWSCCVAGGPLTAAAAPLHCESQKVRLGTVNWQVMLIL